MTETKAIATALEHAKSWKRLAHFLQANPDIAELASAPPHNETYLLVYVGQQDDPLQTIVGFAQRAAAAGAVVEEHNTAKYGSVRLHFGTVYLRVYAPSERVCRQVTVGMVPDVRYRLTADLSSLTTGQNGGTEQ